MNINDFSAKLVDGGARPHLFEVNGSIGTIDLGGALHQAVPFLVKAAQLPASTLGLIEVPYRGRKIKIPGDRTFAEWTITIIADGDFGLRDAFEAWSSKINQHESNTSNVDHRPGGGFIGGLSDIYADWEVNQLARDGSVIKAYKMMNCFPSEISAMDLNFETTDSIHEFTVTMQYTYWTALGKKSGFAGANATDGRKPSGAKFTP